MNSYCFALVFYISNVLCVDIEITGDLSFDVKIRNYRQRGMDIDLPLRFSIGNNGREQKGPHYKVRGGVPRVAEESSGTANKTPSTTPTEQTVTAADNSNITKETFWEENNKLRDDRDQQNNTREEEDVGKGEQKSQSKKRKKKHKSTTTTTTVPPECPYKYPEPWEANTVLSNMMNKLTKLFVMMSRSLYENVRPRTSAEAARLRRFKVISSRNYDSFDRIFANMSTEFKYALTATLNYNATRERLLRADDGDGGDGGAGGGGGAGGVRCAEQAAVGRAWRRLLEQAQDTYRTAALRCVDLHLGPWLASRDGSLNTHLNTALSSVNKQLLKDVERIRSEQLRALCKLYQLC